MDRNQIHRDRDIVIDSNIRNELSDRETDIFEEHLLSCKECRDALSHRTRIVGSIQHLAARDALPTKAKGKHRSRKYLSILGYAAAAAGVALVVGLFLFPGKDHSSRSTPSVVEDTGVDTMKETEPLQEEIAGVSDPGEEDTQKELNRKTSYLAEFQANPVYENLIGVQYRSGNLRVESPPDSIECKKGTSIEIRYEGTDSDSLFLVVLNRQGEILMDSKICSPYKLKMQFPEGLYYWQLTDEEETLHTAKIFVMPKR